MSSMFAKNTAALILASLIAAPALASDHYTVDAHHTWPMFEVNHLGFTTQRGRFNQSAGDVTLDMTTHQGSVNLTIQTGSLDMGFDKWDEHLKSETFFNAAVFPTMQFTSNKLRFEGDKVVAAEGNFTLLGVTRPLTVNVSNFRCGE
ncbi:MAG: YceI family protein, partial [Gallionella sp.]|nr:YceI family protein [Gallionella sp.]